MANREQLDILKQGIAIWNQWRKVHADIHPDLKQADLRQVTLRQADLRQVTLIGADLSGADLSGADLSGADLSFTFLSLAHLNFACLSEAILKQGNLKQANLWQADLSGTDLNEAHLNFAYLSEAILSGASLRQADLRQADLTKSNLNGAILSGAFLNGAHLNGADLSGADLSGADLSEADLRQATFKQADLSRANLWQAILGEADFTEALIGWTLFGHVDLSAVKGLETVKHAGPSSIGIDAIYRSKGNLPEAFLQGAGIPDFFIEYMHPLVDKPIDYYSCFISYSSKDQDFAERLYADLQSNGVRCWFAPHDLKIGDKIRRRIDESIRVYDKLLLVLSQYSVVSTWVEYEVERALNKEPKGIPNVLFPIRLDDAVMQCKASWADDIRDTRHVGDFIKWRDYNTYQTAFQRLLRDLKTERKPSA